jgi:peptide/nickel transport system substrate-binding protein
MQQLFVSELPAVPLYPNPSWGVYNTKRFVGFPSAENPYALLSPNTDMQFLFTLLNLKPVTR